jgi:hypothetical protein
MDKVFLLLFVHKKKTLFTFYLPLGPVAVTMPGTIFRGLGLYLRNKGIRPRAAG